MDSQPPHLSRWKLISALCLAAAGLGLVAFFLPNQAKLESSPTLVRPWAEADFLKMTKPVRSPGKPSDPQYQARHGGSSPSKNPNYKVDLVVEPPSTEFVPDFEVIEFDAPDGFTAKSGSGTVRWLAAKAYDLPPNTDHYSPKPLPAFHPDGRPMSEDEASAMGLTKKGDLGAWGYELNGEFGTALRGSLNIAGFENPEWKFQDVFDAATHVSVRQAAHLTPTKGGMSFGLSLAILHDAPLLAVIDLAHGETQDFTIPVSKGATVSHTDFRIEVIDLFAGTVGSASWETGKSGKAIKAAYGTNSSPSPAKTFSVIYQINPPSMTTAVSVDALDATGNVIDNNGRFMENVAPVSKFDAPLATATSLRVRYRPHQTRLLLKMKSLPGVAAPNIAPADLFDVEAPRITFRDPFNMRRFIALGSQFKDITGTLSYDTPAAFPETLTHISPRQVAERYLALDSGRRMKIDPVAMTIEFEQPKKPSWLTRTMDWFKTLPWKP